MKKFGVGTYTTKTGQVIQHSDLPPEVQGEIQRLGITHKATDINHSLKQSQQLKGLYDPATRNSTMDQIQGDRMVATLNDRLSKKNM